VRIDVITLFPEVFEPVMGSSMLGIAREKGALEFHAYDLRDWALPGVHRQVDDAPYGGGAGMVLRPEPVFDAVEEVRKADARPALVVLMTPQGRRFDQPTAERLATEQRLLIVCGRYEGFDERIRSLADLELSIGDFVLTGGELPAMVVADAVTRLLPGVLGGAASAEDESFTTGLLEYPQYTRPPVFRGLEVPDVLRSGDHPRIAGYRRDQALRRTAERRPDLLRTAQDGLTDAERAIWARSLDDGTEDE
jgi:tRNA (guanine37-N1)-methyltransferase